MTKFNTLYKRASNGKIQEWTIVVDDNSYIVTEGMKDGKLTTTAPHTCEGKNPGKKNETLATEQALKEAKAVYDKKLRRGYVESIGDVDNTTFEKPMKGSKFQDYENEVEYPVGYDDKINGVNFRIKAKGIESTGGEFFLTAPHIINSLKPLFTKYPNLVLMGEGYNPKAEFLHQITEILTVTKKNKDITPELLALSEKVCECWLFDGYGFDNIDENTNWMKRREAVKKLVKGYKYVYVLPYKTANNKAELDIALAENKTRGGEGLMVRWKNCEIKHGKSKYLLKLKHWEDEEFELVDFALGNGNWSTFPKKAIFKLPEPCKDRDGNILTTFASNIEGGEEYLAKLWKDRKDLIGKKFTVKYQLKSAYGIPQIPWLIVPRTYE